MNLHFANSTPYSPIIRLWAESEHRVIHTLEELFGLDKSKVDSIREDLEAGRPVHIEVQALRTQLIQAGFIPE